MNTARPLWEGRGGGGTSALVVVCFDSGCNYCVYPETVQNYFMNHVHTSVALLFPEPKLAATANCVLLREMKEDVSSSK